MLGLMSPRVREAYAWLGCRKTAATVIMDCRSFLCFLRMLYSLTTPVSLRIKCYFKD